MLQNQKKGSSSEFCFSNKFTFFSFFIINIFIVRISLRTKKFTSFKNKSIENINGAKYRMDTSERKFKLSL